MCTEKFLHTPSFHTQQASTHIKHLHTANFYTQHELLTADFHTQQVFTLIFLQTDAFTHSKPLRCQAKGSYMVPAAGGIHLVYGQPPRVYIKIPWGHHSMAGGLSESN